MDGSVQHIKTKGSRSDTSDFEALYSTVRRYENKVYTDAQVRMLPDFAIESQEWQIRKRSSGRLLTYLKKKQRFLKILEVGCGNGWLSAKMAALPQTQVTGLDINPVELAQANRVFKQPNLRFLYDTFNVHTFDKTRFDMIVFAASLQYFPSAVSVLQMAQRILNPGGEIHIIDTPFYAQDDVSAAGQRCYAYYTEMGIPAMADHYFHYSMKDLDGFNYRILFNPASLFNRLITKDPFHWIVIKK